MDDLLSAILLWLAPEIDLQAVGVTNGDCYADLAFEAMVKIATYLDLEGAEIAVCPDDMPNPFPENWRRESHIINELPIFGENYLKKRYQQGRPRRTEAVFGDCLANSKEPLTLVTTGPLTNIASLLSREPKLAEKVREMVIMGGALDAPGNVEEEGHDGSAEWNIYADPHAFKTILDSKIPLTLITLDLTNKLPVTREFLSRLDEQAVRSRASNLAAKLWSLVKGFEYYFWDTITAACAIDPSLFQFKTMKIDVTTTGKSQGRISTSLFGGKKVKVATELEKDAFEDLLVSIFAQR
ncbi:MAG: nucleoside hydrolase [Candidatus Melainabacteria bacterium]|nr:nucleoside hydrolase [Candidatus Melainabacteria bacterium]